MRLGWGPVTGGGAALLQSQVVGRRWARTGDGGVRHQRSGWMSRVTEGRSQEEDVAEGGNREEDVNKKRCDHMFPYHAIYVLLLTIRGSMD
jgi:hypothetical protein